MLSILIVIIAVAGIAIGSSGGGGGGSSAAVSSSGSSIPSSNSFTVDDQTDDASWIVSSAEADVYRTSEYNEQWGLETIKAAQAYAVLDKNGKIIAGDGVKIAITDTGAQTSHVDLSANISAGDNHNYILNNTNVTDTDGHGTYIASIAAAVAGNGGIHGVAYDSQIVVAKTISGTTTQAADSISGSSLIDDVKVINASWGYGSYSSYDGQTADASATDSYVIDALNDAKTADILVVIAAGNDGDNYSDGQDSDKDSAYVSNPKPAKPALFANNSDLAGYVLAVGAVDDAGRIADFSNICGVAKNYCLMAPGVDITGAYPTTIFSSGYAIGDGTSQAAPHVSGAAAVLRAAWPHLTAVQTSQILLETSSDFGIAGIDTTYGRGMLNLYGAVQAQGTDNFSFGASVGDESYNISSSSIISDPIFGDAFANNLAPKIRNAVFFDNFGRDYKTSLDKKISSKTLINSTFVNIDNILLNKYQEKNIPLNFVNGNTKINLKIKSYNKNRLQFLTIDNSQKDFNLEVQNGFSFTQNMSNKSSFSFAFNINEIANQNNEAMNGFSFYSFSSLNSNPYQGFISMVSSTNQNQNNFNQFLFTNKISDKLKLNFSLQNSYQSQNISLQNSKKENQISDLSFNFSPNKLSNLTLSFGRLDEFNDNFLNSKSLGAFQTTDNVKTSYVKFSSSFNLYKNIFAISSLSEGFTKASGNEIGIFRNFSQIQSRSQSLGLLGKNIFGGNIGVIYTEPLRVYRGSAIIDVAIARDKVGNVIRYRDEISLKPQGKERDLEIFFAKNLSDFSKISLNLLQIKDVGNIKSDQKQYVGVVNYGLNF